MKKMNHLKSSFILFYGLIYTGYIGFKATVLARFNRINRQWVDKTILNWTKHVLKMIEVDYRIINPHHVTPPKNRAVMLVCNHTSIFDIPLSFLVFPDHSLRMLAKKELMKIPFFGKGMQVGEFPSIDRHNRQQAIKDLKRMQALMESGIMVWVAPEGTRSKTGLLGPFKKGAFITAIEAGAVIIPIGIRGAVDIMPAKTFNLNLNQKAEIYVGEPIDSREYSLENKEALIQRVRESMLELVGQK